MRNIFSKLFNRTVTFRNDITNCVSVLDSKNRGPRSEELLCGFILYADFDKRVICIRTGATLTNKMEEHFISFDDIVTMSRMKDGRLRLWINNAE